MTSSSVIRALPLGVSGLMLGLVALANLLNQISSGIGYPFLALAVGIFVSLMIKFCSDFRQVRHELTSVLPLSSFGTFSMTLLLVAGQSFLPLTLRLVIWTLGLALHLCLILHFSLKIYRHWLWEEVYPSWFIIYVGIAAASITAPAVQQILIGKIAFYLAFLAYLTLMALVLYRLIFVRKIAEPLRANLAITAAPSSLLLLACHALDFSHHWIVGLIIASQGFYGLTFYLLRRLPRQAFNPTWAALTFPSVSTALALKLSLAKLQLTAPVFSFLLAFEISLATGLVCYVTVNFLLYTLKKSA